MWAMEHLQSLKASSKQRRDPSWELAFGASYVPSKHVVSGALHPVHVNRQCARPTSASYTLSCCCTSA
jgi:hypothetical protein